MQTLRMARAAINQLPQLDMNSYALMSATEQIEVEKEFRIIFQAAAKAATGVYNYGRSHRASEKGDDKLRKNFMSKLHFARRAGPKLTEVHATGLQKAMDQLKNNLPPSASSNLGSPHHAFVLAEKELEEFDNRKNTSAVSSPVFTENDLIGAMQEVYDETRECLNSADSAMQGSDSESSISGFLPEVNTEHGTDVDALAEELGL